jgi:hypothetical protein
MERVQASTLNLLLLLHLKLEVFDVHGYSTLADTLQSPWTTG